MKTLKALSDLEVISSLKALVSQERQKTLEVLEHLREVEGRRLYASAGYPSLFAYCIAELQYSEAAAARRISAMRLIKELPEIKNEIADGKITLSNVSSVQSFLTRENKQSKAYSVEQKRELILAVSDKSSRECEKVLAAKSPESALPRDQTRPITETHSEVRFTASRRLLDKLEKLKGLLAHQIPGATSAELFEKLADLALAKLDPLSQKETLTKKGSQTKTSAFKTSRVSRESNETANPAISRIPLNRSTPASELPKPSVSPKSDDTRSRFIPISIRRQVWQRDRGQCTYRDPNSNKLCHSHYALQVDHIRPFAQGGQHTPENLRLLCASHNRYEAIKKMGKPLMSRWISAD